MVAQIGSNSANRMIETQHVIDMDTPEFTCYANNNNDDSFIPGLPQPFPYSYSPVTSNASCMPVMPSSIYQNGQMGQSANTSFTFTNPTQGNAISYGTPLYTAPISSVPCPPPQYNIVPGIGAQWQHTVPQNMPWAAGSQGSPHVTEFTAQPYLPYQTLRPMLTQLVARRLLGSRSVTDLVVSQCVSRSEPKASCSFTQRRPKRHYIDDDFTESSSPIPKLHVTDEMMMARMRGLHITSPNTSTNSPDTLQQASWRKFRDLEESLDDDSMYNISDGHTTSRRVQTRLPRLRLKAGINPQDLLKPNPILPKTILNDLNKPCMEVVLWKPPGIVRNIDDILSHEPDQILGGSSEDRNLPSRTLQQTVTNVTSSVPSLSYGDSFVPEVTLTSCSMENLCDMEDDDMDL